MNETQNSDAGAWFLSRLGYAIDSYVDRTINRPQVVYDASQAYGVDENGNLYRLGQPANYGYNQTGGTVSVGGNPLMLVLLVGGLLYLASSGAK